jgi:beta-lactamase class A
MVLIAMVAPNDLNLIADRAMEAFAAEGLKRSDFAMTMVDLKAGTISSYNGDVPMYPASVVKMFYMVYAEHLVNTGKIKRTAEFDRAMQDMIKDSNNDATGLILDTITGTTGGSELEPKELSEWMKKRQSVNEWFASQGYQGVHCCQKTWNEGPYGREKQGYGPKNELRNSLTADSCAKLLTSIMQNRVLKVDSCERMRSLLKRDPMNNNDEQVVSFTGGLLPKEAILYSKAGWTSSVRHNVAYVKFADKEKVFAVFTKHRPSETKLMKYLSQEVINL